jgi:uncharacterized FAD-dependent dehydrogenase
MTVIVVPVIPQNKCYSFCVCKNGFFLKENMSVWEKMLLQIMRVENKDKKKEENC